MGEEVSQLELKNKRLCSVPFGQEALDPELDDTEQRQRCPWMRKLLRCDALGKNNMADQGRLLDLRNDPVQTQEPLPRVHGVGHAAARGRRHDGLDCLHGQGRGVRLAFLAVQTSPKIVTRDDSDTISGTIYKSFFFVSLKIYPRADMSIVKHVLCTYCE